MAIRDGSKKKEETTRYLRAVFGLESALRVVEAPRTMIPSPEHHADQLAKAARELLDILIDDMEKEMLRGR
jgi:hypothetical protein